MEKARPKTFARAAHFGAPVTVPGVLPPGIWNKTKATTPSAAPQAKAAAVLRLTRRVTTSRAQLNVIASVANEALYLIANKRTLVKPLQNAPGRESYPIASFTWIYLPTEGASSERRTVLHQFLKWSLQQGQEVARQQGYATLPEQVLSKAQSAIDSLH